MRDFNHNGPNYGVVNVTDNSVLHKPLAQCSSPQLHHEQTFRNEQIGKEYTQALKLSLRLGLPLGIVAALIYLIYAISYGAALNQSIVFMLIAAGPLAVGGLRLKLREEILNGHNSAQREIRSLLGQRGEA